MIWARRLKLFRKVSTVALVLGALATSGSAQDSYQGKFTLTAATHWGSASLPPGNYTFALPSNSAPYRLCIQGQGVSAILQAATAERWVVSERPELNLVDIADVHTVPTFEAPERGVTLIFWAPTQKRLGHKEARQKTVPPVASAPQTSENRTSIEVHTAGREGKTSCQLLQTPAAGS